MSDKDIVQALRGALGREKVLTEAHALRDFRRDFWILSQVEDLQGRGAPRPACVVRPESTEETAAVVNACRRAGAPLTPFGLGSGVCGGVKASAATVLLDMSAMNRIREIDRDNLLAVCEAGVRGADAEAALAKQGLALGHYPQSMDISSVGGWVATRSMGQFSTAYGGIEDMILGLEAVLPSGDIFETRLTPRSAAGPDLKQLFLGGEGTLGVVTAVAFSVRWKPEERIFRAYYAADMEQGFEAQRYIIQTGWRPPVMRQYDPAEAARLFPDHARGEHCLILLIHEGPAALARAEAEACAGLAVDAGCEPGPEAAAAQWLAERNQIPAVEEYLKQGVVVDTIEIAATWGRIGPIYRGVCASLGEVEGLLLASAHSSHCYRSGLNLYFTFAALPPDSRDMASAYWECWRRTMEAVLSGGGGIAHHHGVGRVRRKWLARELGPGGMKMLGNLKQALDPTGFMNPGVLVGGD